MKLSVVIVNYNVKYFLEQCLLSVQRAIKNIDAEVWVVDNNSKDGSAEMVQQKFAGVKLIANKDNTGFSRANNQAMEQCTGEYVLVLNPDTVVAEDTFTKCIAFMDTHPDAGALGVHMVDGKGVFLPESKRGLPTPAVAFYKMFGLSKLFPKSETFGRYHLGFLPEDKTNEVEILSGAFMFMRKACLDKIGLFDETFFMYGEDIDLSYRVIKGGYKNYYFANTSIIHYKGESTKKGSLNYVKVFYNAMIIFAKKHFAGNSAGAFSFLINIAIVLHGLVTLLGYLFSSSSLFIIDALLSFVGIFFIKNYWATTIKYAPEYYPAEFLTVIVPLYIFLWIVSTYLSGGYDKPFKVSRVLRGVAIGTVAISAIYAFLPEDWRFSRAIIILGAGWTIIEMIISRTLYNLIKKQTLSFEQEEGQRVIVVGSEKEFTRTKDILVKAGDSEVIGFVNDKESDATSYLGMLSELKRLITLYRADEIVFCAADMEYKQILELIDKEGTKLDYKIINPGCDALVGSNSKNTAGDLYAVDQSLSLSKTASQNRKRLFDVLVSIFMLPILPVTMFIVKNFGNYVTNWWKVLTGKKTWVGYYKGATNNLPHISEGVLTPGGTAQPGINTLNLHKLNTLYARYYSIGEDLVIILKNFRKLGQ
jgi:GT2 family glycosyltransferase